VRPDTWLSRPRWSRRDPGDDECLRAESSAPSGLNSVPGPDTNVVEVPLRAAAQ